MKNCCISWGYLGQYFHNYLPSIFNRGVKRDIRIEYGAILLGNDLL
jgi:hypothetical protein